MSERLYPQLKLEHARYAAYLVNNSGGAKVDHGGINMGEVSATMVREASDPQQTSGCTEVWTVKNQNFVRRTEDVNVVDFLLSNMASVELVDKHFENGRFRSLENGEADIFSMSFDDLSDYMESKVAGIYELVENSLHNGHEYGFNRHDLEHVQKVKNRLISLLKAAGSDDETIRIGIVAAYLHDMGNLFSREYHSLASAEMIDGVMPELDENPRFKRRVRRAVQLHNEHVAFAMIGSILSELGISSPDEAPEKFYLLMRERFGDEGLGLVIADKSDALDRSRVSMRVGNGNVVNNDKHYEESLLAHSFPVVVERGSASWNIQFNPNLTEDDPYHRIFKSAEGSRRAIVSEGTRNKRRNEKLPYFYSWLNNVMSDNIEKFRLATCATFSLFPRIGQMSIRLNDKDGFLDEMQGLHVVFGFDRNRPNESFDFMKELEEAEKIKLVYERQKGRIKNHFKKNNSLFFGERVNGTIVDEIGPMKILHVFSENEEKRALKFLSILYGDAVPSGKQKKLAFAGN